MISSPVSRMTYAGAGLVGPFAFTFKILDVKDLLVTKRQVTGVEVTLANVTDWSLAAGTNVGDPSGSINLVVALAIGENLTIRRVPALLQPTSLQNQTPYYGATHEAEFDRLTMQIQELQDVLGRSFGLSESYDPAALNLKVQPQTGAYLGWASPTQLTNFAAPVSSGVVLPGDGRTVPDLTTYLLNNSIYNPRDYGALGNDLADDLNALVLCATRAKAAGSIMWIPKGIYRHSAIIDWLDMPQIIGVAGQTIFKPTAAVGANPAIRVNNTVQAFGMGDWNPIENITVDGVLNPTGTGWAWGTNALTSGLHAQRCRAINFIGAGGLGMTFGNLVDCRFEKFLCRNNTEGGKIVASDPNCPTTCCWESCQWRESTGTVTGGLVILQGYDLSFPRNIFESNKARGCYIPATGVVNIVSFDQSWFEANWIGDGAPLTKFHLQVDGSGGGGDVSFIDVSRCKFAGQNKSVSFKSAANVVLDRNVYPNLAATIEFLSNAFGRILNDGRFVNQDYNKLVSVSGAGASVTTSTQLVDSSTTERGDAAFGLTFGVDDTYQKGVIALTANRLVTLNDPTTVSSGAGARFTISHSSADAFNFNVQRADATLLKAIPQNTWSEFYHDGLVWKYFRSGTV